MALNNNFDIIDRNMSILNFAMDNIHEAVFLIDNKSNLRFVNAEACSLLKYTRNELLNMKVSDVDINFPTERWNSHWKDLRDNKTLTFESFHRTKNDKLIPVEINANYFIYDNKEFNLALVRNITDRKATEKERHVYLNFLSNMDRINQIIQSTNDLDQMIGKVLDTIISIFNCDRAWLLFPLDPKADSWNVPHIRYKQEFKVTFPRDGQLEMTPEIRETFRIILEAKNPISFGSKSKNLIPPGELKSYGVLSQMAMPLFPKTGKPWMFGLHQCSTDRAWTKHEEQTFEQIGRRLGDAISTFLFNKNLQQSEEKYRRIIENSIEGIMVLDTNGIISFANDHFVEMLGYSKSEIIILPKYLIFIM